MTPPPSAPWSASNTKRCAALALPARFSRASSTPEREASHYARNHSVWFRPALAPSIFYALIFFGKILPLQCVDDFITADI